MATHRLKPTQARHHQITHAKIDVKPSPPGSPSLPHSQYPLLDRWILFFSSRRRHTSYIGDWSSDVCSSDLPRHGTRSVLTGRNGDAAALLTVLAGYDPDDPATAPLRERPPPDYSRFLDGAGLKGARIGVMRHFAGFHEEVDALFERALAALHSCGAVLVDPADIANADKLDADEQIVLAYEFKDGINRYLATRVGGGPRTLQDLIAFDDREAGREMPFFRQELFLDAQASTGLTDSKYLEAHLRSHRLAAREGIDAALAKDHLDALVAPTVGPAWTTDLLNGDHVVGGGVTTPPAVAGYPHITVPMGAVHGLPVGLSFVGAAWNEGRLVSYAYAYEQTTHARQPPQFRPTEP